MCGAPKHVDDPGELIVLACSREKGQAKEELDGDATERPHIDGGGVGHAEQDFRRAVKTRLDISIDGLTLMAGGAEIDDFDLGRLETVTEGDERKGEREQEKG